MKVFYGIVGKYLDITSHFKDQVYIPSSDDKRAKIFSDPLYGVLKHVLIIDDNGASLKIDSDSEYLNFLENGKLFHMNSSNNQKLINNKSLTEEDKLQIIHNNLKIDFGNKYEELPEQLLCVKYIKPEHRVLEFGGNIGRASCVIGSILSDSKNLLVFESDKENAKKLIQNRNSNNLVFNVEPCALSNKKLMQKNWDTYNLIEPLPLGFFKVDTMNFTEFQDKWGLDFDILVVDCEGAIYDIFKDMPEIIKNIKVVLIENDFHELSKGLFVHDFLKQNNFKVDYEKSGGWGDFYNNFYQAWVKNNV